MKIRPLPPLPKHEGAVADRVFDSMIQQCGQRCLIGSERWEKMLPLHS